MFDHVYDKAFGPSIINRFAAGVVTVVFDFGIIHAQPSIIALKVASGLVTNALKKLFEFCENTNRF